MEFNLLAVINWWFDWQNNVVQNNVVKSATPAVEQVGDALLEHHRVIGVTHAVKVEHGLCVHLVDAAQERLHSGR